MMSSSRLSRWRERGEDSAIRRSGEQEVHRPYARLADPREPSTRPLAAEPVAPASTPAPGALATIAKTPAPPRRRPAAHGREPADRRTDTEDIYRSGPASTPRRRRPSPGLDPAAGLAAAGRRGHGLFPGQEPRDDDQPGQRSPVDHVRPPGAVDHLRDRVPTERVPLVVRQLPIAHHRAVLVLPLRLPQEHAYDSTPSPRLMSSDTPRIVCLHNFLSRPTRHSPDQPRHGRSSTHVL